MTSAVTNQKTSIDYGLIKLKEVNIRYFNEKPELLKMGDNAEEALIILSNAFGVSETTPVRVMPIFGINLVINTPISTLNKLFKLNRRITTFFIHNDADRM